VIGIKCISVFTETASEEKVERILQKLNCGCYLSVPLLLRVERIIEIKKVECCFFIIDAQDDDFFEDAFWEYSLSMVITKEIQIRRQEGYCLVWVSFSFQMRKVSLSLSKENNSYL
jgi:hypothetical protein